MDKPIPPDTELHRKLAHLSVEQRRNVLALLREMLPKHNDEALKYQEEKRKAKKD